MNCATAFLILLATGLLQDPTDAKSDGDRPAKAESSQAERITQLRKAIQTGEKQIAEIQRDLDDPNSEYVQAEQAFRDLDSELTAVRKRVDDLRMAGNEAEAEAAAASLPDLEKRRRLARDRFDLAINERKASQEQLANLVTTLAQDRRALERLTAPSPPAGEMAPTPTTEGTPAPTPATPADKPAGAAPAPGPQEPDAATRDGDRSTPAAPQAPPSKELREAQEQASTKQEAALRAEQEARSITDRLAQTQKSIDLERELLQTARQKAANAGKTKETLDVELRRRMSEGASWSDLAELRAAIRDAEQRLARANEQTREHRDKIDALQTEYSALQRQEIAALREAEEKQKQAQAAKKELERLQNPFTPRNLLKWTINHGPRVALTLVAMFVILGAARVFEKRFVRWIAMTGRAKSAEDRENRAQTLVSVMHNAARVVVIGGGLLIIVDEFGVNIIPLVGGAAVLGLAAAFGAQNLVRDYFYGFIMLLENQYTVNDVIRIGNTGGIVERITLRMTVLRDLEGTVHFIPHGTIDKVSNMTHGWSRALFSIGVAYKEEVDRVMEVLMGLARDLRVDPDFGHMILDDPEMLGVDAFGDSAVVIKFFIKTRPLKQWSVKRELHRRIKNKFDQLGIEIPFPHRTVFYHGPEAGAVAPPLRESTSSRDPYRDE